MHPMLGMNPYLELDWSSSDRPQEFALRLRDACRLCRVVKVTGTPSPSHGQEFWETAIERCGPTVSVDEDPETGKPTGARWSSVRFDPAIPMRFRFSSDAQPLHTDGSYLEDPPSTVFLVCERQAVLGGATLFLDCDMLEEHLKREAPLLFHQLLENTVWFEKGANRVERSILAATPAGLRIAWNWFALSDRNPLKINKMCFEFRKFLENLVARGVPRAVRLNPGEAVFFRDDAVLHGRESFLAVEAGERMLWKGGLEI